MAAEEPKGALVTVAKEFRENADLKKLSPIARLLIFTLAGHANLKRDRITWPSQALLAKETGLDDRTIRRHREGIEIFFEVEERDGRSPMYTFRFPDEIRDEAQLWRVRDELRRQKKRSSSRRVTTRVTTPDPVSVTPDSASSTPDSVTLTPDFPPAHPGLSALLNRKEVEKEVEKGSGEGTLPRGGSAVSMPSGLSDLTNSTCITPSMPPLTFEERLAFLRKQAAELEN